MFSGGPAILILISLVGSGFSFIIRVSGWRRRVGRRSWWDWWRFRKCQGEEEIFPGWEDQVDRDRRELVEEVVAWSELGAGRAPKVVADVADGRDGGGTTGRNTPKGGGES